MYKFLHSKGNNEQNKKTTYGMGENICKQSDQKGLTSKIYKQLPQFNNNSNNKQTTQSKNWQKTLINMSPERKYPRPIGTWKDAQQC